MSAGGEAGAAARSDDPPPPGALPPSPAGFTASDALALLDWRRRVFRLYAEIRSEPDPEQAWWNWRETREALFRDHPQSPLPIETRATFGGGTYFDYDPRWRVTAEIVDLDRVPQDIASSSGGTFSFTRIGLARFSLPGGPALELELSWSAGYGGGLFLAFGDETTGVDTYGGGRYLLDTVKGSDLGSGPYGDTFVLDFNFSYNPSCSYDSTWSCPLAPEVNRLPLPVRAGERLPPAP